jgi:hypothetical protein
MSGIKYVGYSTPVTYNFLNCYSYDSSDKYAIYNIMGTSTGAKRVAIVNTNT